MQLTQDMLLRMTNGRGNVININSIIEGLNLYGEAAELNQPHRLVHYLAQLMHESMMFKYDRELWDGKGAQARYEGRADLGNVEKGDGFKFRGRGPIQITGRSNTQQFQDWCKQYFDNVPDFVENPDLINTDPWEGIGPIWYWITRGLNGYADTNAIETITKRINGGLNGYQDRLNNYTRAALVVLGRAPDAVSEFQSFAGITVDGDAGPVTRGKLHDALVLLGAPARAPVRLHDHVITPGIIAHSEPEAEPQPKSPLQSTTIRAAIGAATANGGLLFTAWSSMTDTDKMIAAGLTVFVMGCAMWIFSERIKKMLNYHI